MGKGYRSTWSLNMRKGVGSPSASSYRSVAQSCLTLCHPKDCSPPGSSVHGIFQARILEWVAISSSRGSSQPRDWTCVSCTNRRILYHWAAREIPSSMFRKTQVSIAQTNSLSLPRLAEIKGLLTVDEGGHVGRWTAVILQVCPLPFQKDIW